MDSHPSPFIVQHRTPAGVESWASMGAGDDWDPGAPSASQWKPGGGAGGDVGGCDGGGGDGDGGGGDGDGGGGDGDGGGGSGGAGGGR